MRLFSSPLLSLASLLLANPFQAFAAAPEPEGTVTTVNADGNTVVIRPSGLIMEYLLEQSPRCKRPSKYLDRISVHYKGMLENGAVFDSSYGRNQPFEFSLGIGSVIKGWDEGMEGLCIGDRRKLVIPPDLAYGDSAIGAIPAGSTLIFETELVDILGISQEEKDAKLPVTDLPSSAEPTSHPAGYLPTTTLNPYLSFGPTDGPMSAVGNSGAPFDNQDVPEDKSDPGLEMTDANADAASDKPADGSSAQPEGECQLLGPFSLLIQAALGALALLSLVYKRYREHPRRPVLIWFFDVSKQVFGSAMLHVFNLALSMLSSADLGHGAAAKVVNAAQNAGHAPNPCSFYLLNLAIDTTIGIPILVLTLRLLHRLFLLTPLAHPKESLKSGNYGHPPKWQWWLKQSLIYFIGLIVMKLCVYGLFQILPWLVWVGDWALRWTEGNTAVQIVFVVFVFPLIMNALQYYIIDSFIKDKESAEQGYEQVEGDDRDGNAALTPSERERFVVEDEDDLDLDDDELDALEVAEGTKTAAFHEEETQAKEIRPSPRGSPPPDRNR